MRMPIFVWALTVTASLGLIATSVVAGAMTMLLFDRLIGTSFFRVKGGGDVILFQHLFWFYSHPAVYIMAVPGLGAILEIVPVFARKPLFAYPLAVFGFIGIGVMSFMVWAHHMFVSGMATFFHIPIMLTTELISVPTGLVFLCAVGTLWLGRIRFKVPMLWVYGFLWAFVIGGITGVYLADVPTDISPVRHLFRGRPLPLHDHRRHHLRPLRWDLLLVPEDHRPDVLGTAGTAPLLVVHHRLQPDIPADVLAGDRGHAPPRGRLPG